MPYVTVKKKYQVVIPAAVRKQARIEIGDLLEAKCEKGRVVLFPKSAVDREIAEGLEDLRKGRTHGPFRTHDELIRFLHGEADVKVKEGRRKAGRRK